MADNNEQKLAGAADKAAEALKAAAQAAEQANEQKAEGCGCCGDACRCGDKAENEAAADAAKAEVDELAETAKKLEAANAKAAEHFDLYVRAVAEMENVRRRCAEDVQKAQKFSIEKFAQNLLPVVDSLEKAIEVSQDMEGPMKEGVQATYRQLVHALEDDRPQERKVRSQHPAGDCNGARGGGVDRGARRAGVSARLAHS